MSIDRFEVLKTYLGTRQARAGLRDRHDVERRQFKLWESLKPAIARTPALAHLAGAPFDDFGIVSPQEMRSDFASWNTLQIDANTAHAAAADAENGGSGEVAPGVAAGFSTGTSGTRGVFLASRAERAQYIGQALAKLLPWDALFHPRKIFLCLRADSALYRDVRSAGPFQFRFAPLGVPAHDLLAQLQHYKPDVLIAPSHVLADIARITSGMHGIRRIFYGAEPIGDDERRWIHVKLGVRPDPIYQATEGFLGAACKYGTLHLNEDSLIIERTPVAGTNRFQPIVTDLRRTTQPMVRVQLDDLLELVDQPCVCGSPMLAVRGVEGRTGDLWNWDGAVIAPRQVEAAISQAVGADVDWRAVGDRYGVKIESDDSNVAEAVAAVRSLLQLRGVSRPIVNTHMTPMQGFKRRRVQWRDA